MKSPLSANYSATEKPLYFYEMFQNFFIDMPLSLDHTLNEMSKSLISPARYILFNDTPWNMVQPPTLAPDPHELPIPNKLLPKGKNIL